MKRKLKINLNELIFAFEQSDSIRSYLDTETGQIIEIAEETFSELDMPEAEEPIEDITTYLHQNAEDSPAHEIMPALITACSCSTRLDFMVLHKHRRSRRIYCLKSAAVFSAPM